MPLHIIKREVEGVYVLALEGRLALGEESRGFRRAVEDIFASGITRFVINLERVNYIDSAGLGALIEVHRTTRARGGSLRLSNLSPNIKQALQLARSLSIFETFSTEAEAIANF